MTSKVHLSNEEIDREKARLRWLIAQVEAGGFYRYPDLPGKPILIYLTHYEGVTGQSLLMACTDLPSTLERLKGAGAIQDYALGTSSRVIDLVHRPHDAWSIYKWDAYKELTIRDITNSSSCALIIEGAFLASMKEYEARFANRSAKKVKASAKKRQSVPFEEKERLRDFCRGGRGKVFRMLFDAAEILYRGITHRQGEPCSRLSLQREGGCDDANFRTALHDIRKRLKQLRNPKAKIVNVPKNSYKLVLEWD